ncbi:class I SAM-dependent methyltransferase, partial [Dehalococcoidia bacterium]|nr:class I SAM-dependent methyltransferase [Dehalococcoidia bacterium]
MSITSKSTRIAELAPWVKLAHEHRGWQPDVEPTRSGPPPPWNYRNRAIELAHQSRALIDLGTGGGEQFAQICQGFEGKAVATESWTRNVPVASALLHPLGVQVVKASSLNLPFGDSSFDLLLNRHERFAAAEAARV